MTPNSVILNSVKKTLDRLIKIKVIYKYNNDIV